jgi:hypothetical protein
LGVRPRHFIFAFVAVCLCAFTLAAGSLFQGFVLQIAGNSVPASAGILGEHETQDIGRMQPQAQAQAERLLERSISRYQGATEQIEKRLPEWAGKIEYSKKLQSLIDIAFNSSELRVRVAAVELTLTANKIARDRPAVERLTQQLKADLKGRPWRMWMLAMLANRGVEVENTRRTLLEFIHDPDEQTRQWAVESLAMLGTDDVIEPLLEVFGLDPSPAVRERAACGLAESGMMTREQRRKAIPGLLGLMDRGTLDQTTQGWVFQALREISGQDFGTDRAAWHASQVK